MRLRKLILAAALAAPAVLGTAGAASAAAPPVPAGHSVQVYKHTAAAAITYNFIQHVSASGPCMDMPNNSQSNGTQFQIWVCNGHPQQGFALVTTGWQTGCTVTCDAILTDGSGKCVDLANGGSDGGKIQQWSCLGDEDQAWQPVSVNNNGTFPVYYANPRGYCIDLTNDNERDGTLIQAWGCPLDRAEEWYGP